jgi:hypothetical protein
LDGGRRFGIGEDGAEGFQTATAQIVQFVAERQDGLGASLAEGGGELRAGLEPTVDGGAMDAEGCCGGAKGRAGGQGQGDFLLNGREGGG